MRDTLLHQRAQSMHQEPWPCPQQQAGSMCQPPSLCSNDASHCPSANWLKTDASLDTRSAYLRETSTSSSTRRIEWWKPSRKTTSEASHATSKRW